MITQFVAQPTTGSGGNLTFKSEAFTSVVTSSSTGNIFVQFEDGNGNLIGSPTKIGAATVIPLLKLITPPNGSSYTGKGGAGAKLMGTVFAWEDYPSRFTPSPAPINPQVTITSSDPSVYFSIPGQSDSTVETLSFNQAAGQPIVIYTLFRLWFMGDATSTITILHPLGGPTSSFTFTTTP